MANNWKTYKLSEITTKIGSGATPRGGKEAYKADGISLIRSQNVLDFSFSTDGLAFIDEKQAEKLKNVQIESRDILLNITGDSVARVCQVPDEWIPARVNQHVAIIRANKEILSPEFLLYSLLTEYNKNKLLILSSAGATRNAITKSMIEDFEISLPPLAEQKAIASILFALDDKIENNLAMNRTLEEMAMALYKHWFVDFGPFKDGEFVDTELGMIPKGWEVSTIGHHFDSERGLSYKGKFLSEERVGVPMHNLNSVYEGGYYKHKGLKWYTGEYKDRHVVRPGDLIVTNTEQGFEYKLIGSTALIPKRYGDLGIFSHHLYKISSKKTSHLTNQYLYYRLLDKNYRYYVTAYANGTTVNMLAKEGLIMPKLIVPPKEVISEFSTLVSDMQEMSEQNLDENQTLTEIRDTMLPKLISGEVHLKEYKETLANVL